MATVYLDGELVDFEGQEPGSLAELWRLIEGHLGASGRVLEEARVDGRVAQVEEASEIGAYAEVAFRSVSVAAKLGELSQNWQAACRQVLATAADLAQRALRQRWKATQEAVVALLEESRGFVEGYGLLEGYGREQGKAWAGAVSGAYADATACIDRLVTATQAGDCVAVSEELALRFEGAWQRMLEAVEGSALPALRKEAAGG